MKIYAPLTTSKLIFASVQESEALTELKYLGLGIFVIPMTTT